MRQNTRIEMIKVEDLIPYAKNSRTHTAEQVAQIAGSIKEFGFTNPVLIDADNGIIAGHGRVLAAQKLGRKNVPSLRLSHLSETQKRAYIIADNKLAMNAGWDDEMLSLEIKDLKDLDFDISLTGFDELEVSNLLRDVTEGETDPDEVPEPPEEPTTKLGDLFELGDHRLLCGDATSAEDVARLMDGSEADIVFTDPPYGVDYDGGHAVKGIRREKLKNDESADIYSSFLHIVFQFSKRESALYLWFSDSKSAAVTAAVTAAGYSVRNTLIWNKNLAQFGAIGAQYKSKHEPCLYCFKTGCVPFWSGSNNEVSVWDISRAAKNEFHPTQKPVELPAKAITNSCPIRGSILDPFLGSGTTLIAAEQLNRKCYGMEISPAYCDVIVKRWEDFTGKKAVREGG